MAIDYSKFTSNSRSVIQLSSELSRQLGLSLVEPQVLTVAIIQECNEMVLFLLHEMGIEKNDFCQHMVVAVRQMHRVSNNELKLSNATVEVLSKALHLAQEHHAAMAAPEHLFWALLHVNSTVKDIMRSFSIKEQCMQAAVETYRNGNNASSEEVQRGEYHEVDILHRYAHNMIEMAQRNEIDPVIGRDDEIRRIIQVIVRKTKNNPILVGEPGTGKTAIIEGLANRIISGDIPQELKNIKLYNLDMGALVAGASMQGEFEHRLKQVVEVVKSDPNIVLFIDEIHLLIGAGRTSGSMDAANILKPALARGDIKVIGATTLDEYRKYVERDKAFERRFQRVTVNEPNEEDAIAILRGIKERFEHHHRIKILDEAVVAAVKLSSHYVTDRFLPDKAIDLLDEAAAQMRIDRSTVPHELDELARDIRCKEIERESIRLDDLGRISEIERLDIEISELREKENTLNAQWQNERQAAEQLQRLRDELTTLSANREQAELMQQYETAVALKRQESALMQRINAQMADFENKDSVLLKLALDEDEVRQVLTKWTGIPISRLTANETERLAGMEYALQRLVFGQDEAVKSLCDVIRRNRMGFTDANRPVGSFLFMGTTGVGKTELAKALAEYLFGSRDMITRLDMSEYQQEFSVSRLFGAPPGYVGYDQGGQLTESVRRKPYSVILLDEIEKAHPKVFETLLQVLDDGRMTDGQGHLVDFKNTIIIMTSNLGSDILRDRLAALQSLTKAEIGQVSDEVLLLLKQRISPEFINRIDDIIMFNPLSKTDINHIVKLQMDNFVAKSEKNGLVIKYNDDVINLLSQISYYPEYGARPVKRTINHEIVDRLTQALLLQQVSSDVPIAIKVVDNTLQFFNAHF